MSNTRSTALHILSQILDKNQNPENLWHQPDLSDRDRRFVRMLVATTVRRLGEIDTIIREFLQKPLSTKAGNTRHILRLGITQLYFMDVPDHAAVNNCVDLCAKQPEHAFRPLVNGVLRNAGRALEAKKHKDNPILNLPRWMREKLINTYGKPAVKKITAAHLVEAPLDLMVKDPENWHIEGADPIAPHVIRLKEHPPIPDLPGYEEGAFWVQDMAATLPVLILGDVTGKDVLDLCAAPGGKTAQLIFRGANVTAVDRSEPRMEILRENMARLKMNPEMVVSTVQDFKPEKEFDAVLIDAPCSATGTIRRHPELPWTKSFKDLEKLIPLQKEILSNAASFVKKNGLIIYATCSLLHEENQEIIEEFLSTHKNFERVPLQKGELPDDIFIDDGDLRTLPYHWKEKGGMDGFYACRLHRKK